MRQFTARGPILIPTTVPYVGPGDIVTYLQYGGTRAYNLTKATALVNAIQIVDLNNLHPLNIPVTATGGLDASVIAGWSGSGTKYVTTVYDQVGGNNWTQGTVANMPTLVNGFGGYQLVAQDAATSLVSSFVTLVEPWSIDSMLNDNGSGGSSIFGGVSGQAFDTLSGGATTALAGGSAAASANQWHSIQHVYNGASSHFGVDGSVSNQTLSSPITGNPTTIYWTGNQAMTGAIKEIGYISSLDITTFSASLYSNRQAFWGAFP